MIRLGFLTALAGVGLLMLPYPNPAWAFPGLLIVGIGAAPVYPAIIHSTPDNFGKENSQAIIGIQMASAYVGSTFMPPVFGLLAEHVSIALYPFYLAVFLIFGLVMSCLLYTSTVRFAEAFLNIFSVQGKCQAVFSL